MDVLIIVHIKFRNFWGGIQFLKRLLITTKYPFVTVWRFSPCRKSISSQFWALHFRAQTMSLDAVVTLVELIQEPLEGAKKCSSPPFAEQDGRLAKSQSQWPRTAVSVEITSASLIFNLFNSDMNWSSCWIYPFCSSQGNLLQEISKL